MVDEKKAECKANVPQGRKKKRGKSLALINVYFDLYLGVFACPPQTNILENKKQIKFKFKLPFKVFKSNKYPNIK